MKVIELSKREALKGFNRASELYSLTPPFSQCRSLESATYRKFKLKSRALNLDSGKGGFVQLIWPQVKDDIGVNGNSAVCNLVSRSGAYRVVRATPAGKVPKNANLFDNVFANC